MPQADVSTGKRRSLPAASPQAFLSRRLAPQACALPDGSVCPKMP